MVGSREHWESVYKSKDSKEVSWFAEHLEVSRHLITQAAPDDSHVVDVGGGAATLVDDLLTEGYRRVTVLDLSETAVKVARARLQRHAVAGAEAVQWLVGDVLDINLPAQSIDVWHDRAVFHFLLEASERQVYVEQLQQALKPGGYVVLSTYSLSGPERCSGLPVRRYSCEMLQDELGEGFKIEDSVETEHHTPNGKSQSFITCRFRRRRRGSLPPSVGRTPSSSRDQGAGPVLADPPTSSHSLRGDASSHRSSAAGSKGPRSHAPSSDSHGSLVPEAPLPPNLHEK